MNRFLPIIFESDAIRTFVVCTILSALTITVYHDILSHSFINYDDTRIITNRIDKYDGVNLSNIKDIIFDDYPREEPLIVRDLSYLVNAEFFGELNPLGYLLGNLILHIIAAYLVYRLSLYLLPKQHVIALIAAIIFAIHPVNVESVAWISSRKNPLFVVFLLLAIISYIKYTEQNRTRDLVTSALLLPIALLSKASAICLFPILICYRLTMKRDLKWRWQEVIYYSIIFIATVGFIKWYSGIIMEFGVSVDLSTNRDWMLFVLSAFEYITFYITKLIAPFELSAFYDFPAPSQVYNNSTYLLASLLVITSGLIICFRLFKNNNTQALFLIALFTAALTPYLDLASVDIFVADRYLYLSSASYAIGIAWIAHFLYTKHSKSTVKKATIFSILTLYCILLGTRTIQATTTWESTFSFWLNANQTSPNNIRTYFGLMKQYNEFAYQFPDDPYTKTALQSAKEIGHEAFKRFCPSERECNNDIFIIASMLGGAYALEGNIERSDFYYGITFRINPDYIKGRYRYAIDLLARKDYKEALNQVTYIETNANPHIYGNILKNIRNRIRPQIPADLGER